MPAIGHLHGVRRTGPRACSVRAGPVPADDLGARMLAQPVREGVRLTIAQQIDGPAGFRVDQHGAIVPAAAEREIVHAEDAHQARSWDGQRHDQPQQAGPARNQAEQRGEPRCGPAGQGQRYLGQRPRQRRGAAGTPGGQPVDLLGERHRRTVLVGAEEPAYRQPDHHTMAADRRIGQTPLVRAVHSRRGLTAPGARSGFRAGTRPDAQPAAGQLRGFEDSSGQVRQ